MFLTNRLENISEIIATYQAEIDTLQEKIRGYQLYAQQVSSVSSAMESALQQVQSAVAMANEICPDELDDFQTAISECFNMPVAALEATVEPVESKPVQSDVIESEPVSEPVTAPVAESVAAPVKVTDKEPTITEIKERFRTMFRQAKNDKELSVTYVRQRLYPLTYSTVSAKGLKERTGKAFWMVALTVMDEVAKRESEKATDASTPTEKAA